MSERYLLDGYHGENVPAAYAEASARVAFIRRTYATLAMAVLSFMGLAALLHNTPAVQEFFSNNTLGRGAWLMVLVLFMAGNYASHYMAQAHMSKGTQLMGLGLGIVLWAVIFQPLLYLAERMVPNEPIALQAGLLTAIVFGGLTIAVFVSGKDFSFMRTALVVASFAALGIIVVSLITGMGLGIWFCFAMVALASGFIIYDTSNVLHHYPTNGHIGAAVALFSDFALLFWYILQIFLYSSND